MTHSRVWCDSFVSVTWLIHTCDTTYSYAWHDSHTDRWSNLATRPWHDLPATRCKLQHTATHCNTLQHTVTHGNTRQHTATHGNTLQHTATHCSNLQQPAAPHVDLTPSSQIERWSNLAASPRRYIRKGHLTWHIRIYCSRHCNTLQRTATPCNTLQRAATHCNTLQRTAPHCNTLQHAATHWSTSCWHDSLFTNSSLVRCSGWFI